jgi:hypothetical protein
MFSFVGVTIPKLDDPRHEKLAKRCESCRPMGLFRSSENELLLCYDGSIQSEYPLSVPDCPSQSLGCMWTGMATQLVLMAPLNGKA